MVVVVVGDVSVPGDVVVVGVPGDVVVSVLFGKVVVIPGTAVVLGVVAERVAGAVVVDREAPVDRLAALELCCAATEIGAMQTPIKARTESELRIQNLRICKGKHGGLRLVPSVWMHQMHAVTSKSNSSAFPSCD